MNKRYLYTDEQVLKEAQALISIPKASTYTVAHEFNIPQATVWWHLTYRLKDLSPSLFSQVKSILKGNSRRWGGT